MVVCLNTSAICTCGIGGAICLFFGPLRLAAKRSSSAINSAAAISAAAIAASAVVAGAIAAATIAVAASEISLQPVPRESAKVR